MLERIIAENFGSVWNSIEHQAILLYLDGTAPAAQRQHCRNLIAVRLRLGTDDVEQRRQYALAQLSQVFHRSQEKLIMLASIFARITHANLHRNWEKTARCHFKYGRPELAIPIKEGHDLLARHKSERLVSIVYLDL